MKERLTERYKDEQGYNCVKSLTWDGEILHRLAEYEDLEQQGLLVRLPCKVGDKVYWTNGICVEEYEVRGFHYAQCDNGLRLILDTFSPVFDYWLGKNLFLTCAEAEKKLKELKEKRSESSND